MGDPQEMFVMVKEYSDVRMLAMAHCHSNLRYTQQTLSIHLLLCTSSTTSIPNQSTLFLIRLPLV